MPSLKRFFFAAIGFAVGYFAASFIVGFVIMHAQVENGKQWLYYSIFYGFEGELLRLFPKFERPMIIPLLIELSGGAVVCYAVLRFKSQHKKQSS